MKTEKMLKALDKLDAKMLKFIAGRKYKKALAVAAQIVELTNNTGGL